MRSFCANTRKLYFFGLLANFINFFTLRTSLHFAVCVCGLVAPIVVCCPFGKKLQVLPVWDHIKKFESSPLAENRELFKCF